MKLRSMLFVPGDSERKQGKAAGAGADALILDLEDSVAASEKARAREVTAAAVRDEARGWKLFVRVNPFDSGLTMADLAAVVRPGLDGVMLPKAEGPRDVEHLGHCLDALEAAAGMEAGTVAIALVATETPAAVFGLGGYAPHPRLAAVSWGAEDLSAALGASDNREADGGWTSPYEQVRTLALLAARAAGAAPVDTLMADFRNLDALAEDCRRSRRDGFTGRLAIHPDQVPVINAGYQPTEDEVAHARQVVAAFEASPGVGTVGIGGKMYDLPHLKAARGVLERAR